MALLTLSLTGCGASVNNASKPAADVMNATFRTTNSVSNQLSDPQHVQLASKIANGLVKKGYAKQAFAFVVGDQAYVAINQTGKTNTNVTTQQKDRITAAVKQIDGRIHTVSVTSNPQAFHRFQSFANDVQAGKPVSGLWNNFRAMVQNVFPTTR